MLPCSPAPPTCTHTSLLTLATTKGSDHKTTLMDYLASMVEKKDPALLNFSEDLSLLAEARRYPFNDLKSEVARMATKLNGVTAEAAAELAEVNAGTKAASSATAAPAAGAKPANARAAALSEMLAKRMGGPPAALAAPVVPSGDSSSSGGGGSSPASTHPCSPDERREFCAALQTQATAIQPDVDCLKSSVAAVGQWSVEVAKYFAEDPSGCPPERVCGA